MTSDLYSPADLMAKFGLTSEEQVLRLARRNEWPHVRLSNKTIRFTEEDVEQIVARHHQATIRTAEKSHGLPGQTARSKARTA